MSIEEKEERIIKLNEERLDLIKKIKEIPKINYRKDEIEEKYIIGYALRINEINQEIEELIASAKPNRS